MIRVPFPVLNELESLETKEKYFQFLSQKIKNAKDIDVSSCYSSGTITLPLTNK